MKRFFFLIFFIIVAFFTTEAQQVSYSSSNDTLLVRYRVGPVQKTVKLVVGMYDLIKLVEGKVDSLALASANIEVDSISITFTNTDPPKLQIDTIWVNNIADTRAGIVFDNKIAETNLDNLADVLATTPDDNSILIYKQDTGFWETTPYVTGGSVSNADSLGSYPASAYALKTYVNDSVDSVRNQIDSVNITYPDVNTIQLTSGQSILLDPATLEIDEGILTVVGGTGGSNNPDSLGDEPASAYMLKSEYPDSVKNIDSTKIRAVTIETGGTIIIENDTDPPAEITYVGSTGGEGGIRVIETVQVSGTSPTFGIHKNGNISDINPPASMTSNHDWILPDKSGTFAMLDDVAAGSTDSATVSSLISDSLSRIDDSLGVKLYTSFNTEYPNVANPSTDNYVPVMTGTGIGYSDLNSLPISSDVQTGLNAKLNITDTTNFRTFSDLKYAEATDEDTLLGTAETLDSIITDYWNDELVNKQDTLAYHWGVMDTVTSGGLIGYKVESNITVVKVSAYAVTDSVWFNIQERGAATPNTAGDSLFASGMWASLTGKDSTSFSGSSGANFAKDNWIIPFINTYATDAERFGITVWYIKQDY